MIDAGSLYFSLVMVKFSQSENQHIQLDSIGRTQHDEDSSFNFIELNTPRAKNVTFGKKGRTPIAIACKKGKYDVMIKLLENTPYVDIYKEDFLGISPFEHAIRNKHWDCASLIKDEAYKRWANKSHPFRLSLISQMQEKRKVFDEDFFCQLVENDTEAARQYLDFFVKVGNYKYEFHQLKTICGLKQVRTSALAAILNESIIPAHQEAKLELLNHPVLKRVLDIKWELFGAHMYCTELLLYFLMLMAMTNVVLLYKDSEKLKVEVANSTSRPDMIKDHVGRQYNFAAWVFTLVFCIIGGYNIHRLKPKPFYELCKNYSSGKEDYKKADENLHASFCRVKTRTSLLWWTIGMTLAVCVPFCIVVRYFLPDSYVAYAYKIIDFNNYFTSFVLWMCAFIHLYREMGVILSSDPWYYSKSMDRGRLVKNLMVFSLLIIFPFTAPFRGLYRKHYSAFMDKLQLTTYYIILGPFAYLEYTKYNTGDNYAYFFLGTFCTLSIWLLSLRFLEIHRTAGYLLPILIDVVRDVWNYLMFYGIFQCGFMCAFYFLFQQKSEAYQSLWASFSSTYYVLYGDNGFEEFRKANSDSFFLPVEVKNFGMILRMLNCGIIVVLMLNLLVATMNKTVDRNWEKLQSRALSSYARTILRLEIMVGDTEITGNDGCELRSGKIVDENNIEIAHPIFDESVLYYKYKDAHDVSNSSNSCHDHDTGTMHLEEASEKDFGHDQSESTQVIEALKRKNTELQRKRDQLQQSLMVHIAELSSSIGGILKI